MSDGTGIEWTDATWNPVRGCTRVSDGCRYCYAERVAVRFSGPGMPYEGLAESVVRVHGDGSESLLARWTGKIKIVEEHMEDPLRWKRPRRIFVNSMSDLFHDNVPDVEIDRIFAVMALAHQHTFQVLTKRPKRMMEYLTTPGRAELISWEAAKVEGNAAEWHSLPLPNVWLGVSVENQSAADERIPFLTKTPAAVRFLSCEPLLGPIDTLEARMKAWDGSAFPPPKIDWVIAGGESGPHARPMHPDWARSLRDQCVASAVPFFFKQWGEWKPGAIGNYARRMVGDGSVVRDERDVMSRVGKKNAGAELDGVTHKAFPVGA